MCRGADTPGAYSANSHRKGFQCASYALLCTCLGPNAYEVHSFVKAYGLYERVMHSRGRLVDGLPKS